VEVHQHVPGPSRWEDGRVIVTVRVPEWGLAESGRVLEVGDEISSRS